MGKMKLDNRSLRELIKRYQDRLESWEPGYYAPGFYFNLGKLEAFLDCYGQDGYGPSIQKLQERWEEGRQ
jgi:hypothetical protein